MVCFFTEDQRGNVGMIFATTLLPIMGFIGGAIDYSRAVNARSAMQAAVDATALMISKDAAGMTAAQISSKATAYFNALYTRTDITGASITTTYTANTGQGATVRIDGVGSMNTDFMKMVGYPTLNLNVTSTSTWGSARMRVALALDTTGSMASSGKMDALKPAAKSLIDQLKTASYANGDVYVSIIPFNKDVNVGPENYAANWIDWDDWDDNNGQDSTTTTCKQKTGKNGKVTKKCETSTTWVPDNHSTWNGCVTDRDKPYDTQNDAPSTTKNKTLFPAEQFDACPVPLMKLSYDWNGLKAKIDSLVPTGNTNQAIGLAWAWMSLMQTAPLNAPSEDSNYVYQKAIVLMSDGMNTENRWDTEQKQIDDREKKLCENVKKTGITLYTIQVNTNGDPTSDVLKNCASDEDKFYQLTSSSQMMSVFKSIGTSLSKLRLAK